jgi:hypothetical protein
LNRDSEWTGWWSSSSPVTIDQNCIRAIVSAFNKKITNM